MNGLLDTKIANALAVVDTCSSKMRDTLLSLHPTFSQPCLRLNLATYDWFCHGRSQLCYCMTQQNIIKFLIV